MKKTEPQVLPSYYYLLLNVCCYVKVESRVGLHGRVYVKNISCCKILYTSHIPSTRIESRQSTQATHGKCTQEN